MDFSPLFHSFYFRARNAGRHFGFKGKNFDPKRVTLFKDMFDVQMGTYHQREYEGYRSARKDMERVIGPSNYEPEDTCLSYRHLFDLDRNSMSTRLIIFYREERWCSRKLGFRNGMMIVGSLYSFHNGNGRASCIGGFPHR